MIISTAIRKKIPEIKTAIAIINGIEIKKSDRQMQNDLTDFYEKIQFNTNINELKNDKIIKAYRNFFWSIKIDPTKIRPASEALIRRIVNGNGLPFINNVVDIYNKVSVETKITLGAYDQNKVNGELIIRFAKSHEKFQGIGMDRPISLNGNEIVLADNEKIISIYPYRDSNITKISPETKNIIIIAYGVPEISGLDLEKAIKQTIQEIEKYTNGKVSEMEIID